MAKEETSKPKRGRRAKVEVEEEFDVLLKEETKTKSYSNPKLEELARQQEQDLRNSTCNISAEETIRKFTDLNIEISKTLNSLSDKLVTEINYLNKLRQVAGLEKNEIERLHKIDVAQTAIDQLIDEYQTKKQELEDEIESQNALWEQEKESKAAEIEEEEENLAKSRKREIEEYEYKKNLERKKAQDKYEEEIRMRDKQNKEKQESLEKGWQTREAFLKAQENDLATLRKTVEEYPLLLQKEIDKAVENAIRQTETKRSQEIELLKRDHESDKRIAELKIKSLEESLLRSLSQLSAMQNQVDEAKKQVQDIAVKAIEGASGNRTLQFAMEQSKGRPPTS